MVERKLILENFNNWARCVGAFGEYCSNSSYSLNAQSYEFSEGVTVLRGGIDSGAWNVTYVLSNCGRRGTKIILNGDLAATAMLGGRKRPLRDFAENTEYIDVEFPGFRKNRCRGIDMIRAGLKRSGLSFTAEQVAAMFGVDDARLNRPFQNAGNMRIRLRAAIGFAAGKEVFCFPWLSARLFCAFYPHIEAVCKVLAEHHKFVLIPTDFSGELPEKQWELVEVKDGYRDLRDGDL